ncbi:MAG TPA: methyltransferase regulatory domain-containing protein [Azospirillum sp.]|nr:methyltransferase regulatory domain-containing protein [Azospirillum sp.]
MQSWTEGYVSDIAYAHSFYAEMAPAHLAFALTLAGVRPPDLSGPFAYAELGCGQGLTSNLLAGVHGQARFEAVDFLPGHIADARDLASKAGNGNATFLDDSFADYAERDGPDFDIVALHGVWTWVSAENRQILLDILRRRLKPGGVVYVSYNCLPGWAAHTPIRKLLLEHAATGSGPLPGRIEKALGFAVRMARLGEGYFDRVPSALGHLAGLDGKSDSYIAHEYLNRDWTPFYHADVARELASAKLSFAASATLADHVDDANLSPQGLALLSESQDPAYRETLRDYLTYTRFRRDVFVKGAVRLSPSEREQRLRAFRFGLAVPRAEVPEQVTAPTEEIGLPAARPLADALAGGPRTLGELLSDPALAAYGLETLLRTIALLGGAVVPVPEGINDDRVRRFNAAVLERNRHSPEIRQLASPVLGTGVMVGLLERLFLLAEHRGEDPADLAWTVLRERGKRLRREGEELTTDAENVAELKRLYGAFVGGQRAWLKGLGIA